MSEANIKEKEPKNYELGVLVRKEEDLAAVATVVREHGNEMSVDFRARKVALAYPIKKEKEAIFAYANIRGLGEAVKSLEHDLNLRADVLRSLIVLLPKPDKPRMEMPATPVVQKRTTPTRSAVPSVEPVRQSNGHLSNEALTKKIEEILK